MAVVTISRELGSDGTQIAEAVAVALNAICIDKEVLAEMAREVGPKQTFVSPAATFGLSTG